MHSLRVVALNPDEPREDRIRIAVELVREGGIVALPTETFYGLAGDASSPEIALRINRIKGKSADTPILLLVADLEQARSVAPDLPPAFLALAERFWPGPLTMVVRAGKDVPAEISGGRGTVGIRVPGLELPRRLAAALGRPITGVSANLHGQPACRTAQEVVRALPTGIDLVLDGGACPGGAPSTILDLSDGPPRLLRRGCLPLSALGPFLEKRGQTPLDL